MVVDVFFQVNGKHSIFYLGYAYCRIFNGTSETLVPVGVGNINKGITAGVPTPTFNINEDAILLGAGMMAWLGAYVKM